MFRIKNAFIVAVLLLTIASCQKKGGSASLEGMTLPTDTTIRKGVLPNGMTYYLKATDVVKDAASYYIIQNVGSILEEENQRGLAHFLEHMAFNGTKNFEGQELMNTLQKHGVVFGAHINAYTSFDETVYNLDNIPLKKGLVDTCLLILHDWSNYILLKEEEIDAERGVIKEEWRARQNGQMRIMEKTFPTVFNNSKYAERLPIGLMSVVEGFEYQTLKDFYHAWYRTDLQAIAIVGDFNVDEMEKRVKDLFSKIPAVENPKERYIVNIPENKELQYVMATDPEISTASAEFNIRLPQDKRNKTSALSLKKALLDNLAIGIVGERLSDKAKEPETPFLRAGLGVQQLSKTQDVLSLSVNPKLGKQKEAFEQAFSELYRAVKFGVTDAEVARTIKNINTAYENQIRAKDDVSHKQIINVIKANYLSEEPMVGIEDEYEIVKKILAGDLKSELSESLKKLFTKENRSVRVIGVEGQDNLTEEQVRSIISKVEGSKELKAYDDSKVAGAGLMAGVDVKKGSIEKEEQTEEIGATTYTLSNGVRVHYKFADKDKNSVGLRALSYGGRSLLENDELASADLLADFVQMSGLSKYSATELTKVLAGVSASASPQLAEEREIISGGASTKDVETMLQMVYLYFVHPNFDKQVYEVLQDGISNYLTMKKSDIRMQMEDNFMQTVYGKKNPRKRILDANYLKEASFEKIQEIYKERFSNAADFEFFIVGDVAAKELKPLLEKYIASIPSTGKKENFRDIGNEWVSNRIDKDIYLKMKDPKTNVNISYKINREYTPRNIFITNILKSIVQMRMNKTLREKEGGVYSPSVGVRTSKEPKQMSYLSVSFDCNPDMDEKLIKIVHEELAKIANGNIEDTDFAKSMKGIMKEHEQSKDKNAFDMSLLITYFTDGYNLDADKNFGDVLRTISKKDVQQLMKDMIEKGKSFEVVFKPKK